jgi:hypothetical protein
MARIGDSPDDQRINEMNEAAYREQADRNKRTEQDRTTKSFNQVMQDRARNDQAKIVGQKATAKPEAEKKSAADPKKQQAGARPRPGDKGELGKRAAMSSLAMQGNLTKGRSKMGEASRDLEAKRGDELSRAGDDDRERVDKDTDRDERDVVRRSDEQQAQAKQSYQGDPGQTLERGLERDGRRGGGQGHREEEGRAEGVGAVEGPKAAHTVKIPQEILEHIAKAVAVATAADGRAEVVVDLKGTMLEGVTLKVSAKAGKVRCTFEGCDRNTRNLIESSKGELMRQLGKRGLELEILRAK